MIRALLAALGFSLLISPAWAQTKCAPTPIMEKQLEIRHGERKFSTGVSGMDITEIFVNPDTGTFTIVSRKVRNISCILVAGKRFRLFKHVKLDEDS